MQRVPLDQAQLEQSVPLVWALSQRALQVWLESSALPGLAWIPAGHILRMSPPLIMEDDLALKAMDLIEESIWETAAELGYAA